MAWEVLEKKEGIKLPSGGSSNGSRLKIFAMDGLVENNTVFSQNPEHQGQIWM